MKQMTLTKLKYPAELISWMDKNLKYKPEEKKYVRTPEQVFNDKKGHCWETAEFARSELESIGIHGKILYLQDKDFTHKNPVTHSTLIIPYLDKWMWFEWAWFKHSGIHGGISGPSNSMEGTISFIESRFIEEYKFLHTARLGPGGLPESKTQSDYINMVNDWEEVSNLKPNILYHGSHYLSSVLRPGFYYSKKKTHWDITESNKYLYATTEKTEATILGFASAIEKKFKLNHFSSNNRNLVLIFDEVNVKLDDLFDLDVYLYSIPVNNKDAWVKNNNATNNLNTEYKTNKTIHTFTVEKINIKEFLKDYNVELKTTHKPTKLHTWK